MIEYKDIIILILAVLLIIIFYILFSSRKKNEPILFFPEIVLKKISFDGNNGEALWEVLIHNAGDKSIKVNKVHVIGSFLLPDNSHYLIPGNNNLVEKSCLIKSNDVAKFIFSQVLFKEFSQRNVRLGCSLELSCEGYIEHHLIPLLFSKALLFPPSKSHNVVKIKKCSSTS